MLSETVPRYPNLKCRQKSIIIVLTKHTQKKTTHYYILREWKHELSPQLVGNADLTHTIQKMVIMLSTKYGMRTGEVARISQLTLADASWLTLADCLFATSVVPASVHCSSGSNTKSSGRLSRVFWKKHTYFSEHAPIAVTTKSCFHTMYITFP